MVYVASVGLRPLHALDVTSATLALFLAGERTR